MDRKRKRGKSRFILLKLLIAAFIIAIFLSLGSVIALAYLLTRDLPKLQNPNKYRPAQSSQIFDSRGHLLVTLHGEENRFLTRLSSIPRNLQNAIVAIEDKRFFSHKGIDYEGILRAIFADVESGKTVEGGSTITQQYVRNIYITREKTFTRKLKEAALAWQLEKVWPKRRILEGYLNTIYFGQNAYGVQAASLTYFGKSVHRLNLAQCALLAALPRSPIFYSPYTNSRGALLRRNLVIENMLLQRMITPAQAKLAMKQKLGVVAPRLDENYPVPYFIDYVKQLLMKKYGANVVFKGGLRIYTTIDLRLQRYAEAAIENVLGEPGDPASALVAIDPKTGYVKALVGGKNFRKSKFNLATQGHRQPGSAFKPFVLTTAIKDGIPLSKVYESAPQTIPLSNGKEWEVSNYDDNYRGKINLLTATEFSDNTVYAQLAMDVGPKRVAYTAETMGIKTRLAGNPAMALGGLGRGVTPLEMASAYSTLAARGYFHAPTPISKITDSSGRVIWRAKIVDKPILKPRVADLVNYALQKVIQNGTGRRAGIGRPAAGKTGTATDYRDAWFVGYTPDLTACVWMGYPKEQVAMRDVHGTRVAGGTFPAEIWANFMNDALVGVRETEFSLPSSEVTWVKICKETGLKATERCPDTVSEPFIKGTQPKDYCTVHKAAPAGKEKVKLKICLESGKIATPNCPRDQVIEKTVSVDQIRGYCNVHGKIKNDTIVPNVVGKTIDSATRVIERAGFSTYVVRRSSGGEKGVVFGQLPSGGTFVERGITVTLMVAK